MIISKRVAFYISISAIILYWIYIFFITASTTPNLPSSLSDLLTTIVKNKIILLFVIYFLLRLERDGFQQMGFTRQGIFKQIFFGILYGLGIWVFINVIFNSIMSAINPNPSNKAVDMVMYMKDLKSVALWMPVIILASFEEEFQRIFVLTRFQKWFGYYGLYFSLVISSIAFGVSHLYQGVNLAIGTGLGGLFYGIIFIRKRSAVEVVTCHAIFNVLSIIGGYMMNNK